jgi:UDP-N-acetylglucosamine diphosphorylase / glucose-1-phosphate thymidylyltransferase / UDP-N-acetylgalactosamine diphosphorylase / glucosamine-1-phosphate N-acetyltransferase / galactosamine-1-phosphate N-acetyltransferase
MSAPGGAGVRVRGSAPAGREREAVVLAAGRGVRLGALTASTPKVLLAVNHRALLDYHLEALSSVGVRRVWLVVGYRAEQVEQHVGDGRRFGLEVVCLPQGEPRGTGDAVRVAGPHIGSDPFLVCNGDVFVADEASVLGGFLADDLPKIAGAWVPNGGAYGRLVTRETSGELRLVGIEEKDGRPTAAWVNAGLYLLPRALLRWVDGLVRSPRGEFELTDALRAYVAQDGTVRVVPVGAWVDVGTAENLALANQLAATTPTGERA